MDRPLVTIICISYNHERFVKEALESVFHQTYPNIQLIVVDDASSDSSIPAIAETLKDKPDALLIAHDRNKGNCKSFNEAFTQARGDLIIDLAADDVLMPERVEKGVDAFLKNPGSGVNYCDAVYINSASREIGSHHRRDKQGKLLQKPPSGDVYKDILERYFICPPTLMVSREVIESLNGYDENLAYEDFDFLVRASRRVPFTFTDEVLVKKRMLRNSLSSGQYAPGSKILHSTYLICEKAYQLNRTTGERLALIRRIQFELRQALISKNPDTAIDFADLLQKLNARGAQAKFLVWAAKRRMDLSWMNHLRLSSSSRMLR